MNESLTVQVADKWLEAESVSVLELQGLDNEPLPAYQPGPHVDVFLRDGLCRQYSLSRYRPAPQKYQIAVLKESSSRGGSEWVHENLKIGDKIQISTPRNLFSLSAQNSGSSLLFAGGIGVTPILCMAEYLAHRKENFHLHYSGRTLSRMAYLERLSRADLASNVSIYVDSDPDYKKIDLESILTHQVELQPYIYVCGPEGYINAVISLAQKLGWPEEKIHFERFTNNALSESAEAGDSSFEVQIASTGLVVQVAADESIIEALARHDVFIETSCEQGICGSCLTSILEGVPEHRDLYLSEQEKKANNQFLPCCARAKTKRLILDL